MCATYDFVEVNIMEGEGRAGGFLKLNPAGKVPVLVDSDLRHLRVSSDLPVPGREVSRVLIGCHPSGQLVVRNVISGSVTY